MLFQATLLSKNAFDLKIRKMKRSEVQEALNVCFKSFKQSLGLSEEEIKTEIVTEMGNNFSSCYVAESDGKIIGGYFLKKQRKPAEDLVELGVKGLENKKGVQGVAIFVLPEYRNSGAGRQLRNIPQSMGVDYIWGQHYKELNNVNNWVNFGRTYLGDKDDYAITFQSFTSRDEARANAIHHEIKKLDQKIWDLKFDSYAGGADNAWEYDEDLVMLNNKKKELEDELESLSIKK